MKTGIIFGIVGMFAAVILLLFLLDSGAGSYEGIRIERLSGDGFERYQMDNDGNLNIVKITDDDLSQVPKIKNLIKKSLQQEFSLTSDYGGEMENNIEVFSGLATYEITPYKKWGESLGISTGRAMYAGSVLEYDGQYYLMSFTIA